MNLEEKAPVLDVRNLTVAYLQDGRVLPAVRDFQLRIHAGETYGLVGESGSGKSTVALAIMRYLGGTGRVLSGEISFNGQDLLALDDDKLRTLWGREIALVPQDPQSSLNPSLRVGEQIAEILRQHMNMDRAQALSRAAELLAKVRVPDPDRVVLSFPHQISGGMQQRVLIAMALSTEPRLLILDEPTTGLDVTTQAAILDLFRELTVERQTAVLYVTHNLGVIAELCDRVTVLYAGELVEDGPVNELFKRPLHPYTEGLLDCVPQIGQSKAEVTLRTIPGRIPPLGLRPHGCVFAPRCSLAIEECAARRPYLDEIGEQQKVRCIRWQQIATGDITTRQDQTRSVAAHRAATEETVIDMNDVCVYFEMGRSVADVWRRQPGSVVKAVDGVDLSLGRARTLGIVGESGSGKTTLARAVIGLSERTSGDITFFNLPLPAALSSRSRETLQRMQFVFQNPDEALNPNMTVGQTLRRPFITLLGMSGKEADAHIQEILAAVKLPASYAAHYPDQLSGGEKQRVAIARAFATAPDLLVADEPVSALDVSVQASILSLLQDLQIKGAATLVFISHDLAVVGYLADQIAVMYLGQIMELADSTDLFTPPFHPYTEALLAAVPDLIPGSLRELLLLEGDAPSQIDKPTGCPFHTRCPRVLNICHSELPSWQETTGGDRIYCHIPLADLLAAQHTETDLGDLQSPADTRGNSSR